jgi:hypothetical protein
MTEENAAELPTKAAMSNSDRLRRHPKPGTLAAQLVHAGKDADDLREALIDRLEQVRQDLSGVKN